MNFNTRIEDVGVAVLQELWNRVTLQAMELADETRDMVLAKDGFQEFSRSISQLTGVLHAMDARKVEAQLGSEFTKTKLQKLNSQLHLACDVIEDCRSGSRLRLILRSSRVLAQMQELAKEIAETISSFQLVNLNIGLNVKTMIANIIDNLGSVEFQSSTKIERISSEIENLIKQDGRNHENAVKLLEQIAEAVGASENTSLVQQELAILKQEKEEMEAQKKQAEALQLSQLIQLLCSTEIVTRPVDDNTNTRRQYYLIDSFLCPLSHELMTEPVAILCGHSFEKKAIQEHFERGETVCPTCKEELPSLDITPNLSLRGSIQEWKQRDMDLKFQAAIQGINSDEESTQNGALQELKSLLKTPLYAAKFSEENPIPKLVGFLKNKRLNTAATLECLGCLARHSEDCKESIVKAGAIHLVVKHLYKGEVAHDAIAVLLELSSREAIAEEIGNAKNSIPLLVSMLHYRERNVSKKAHKVLQNLSFNTHFVVKMAESGYFGPFVSRFNEGSQETRALMAAALVQMQLKETSVIDLKNDSFIHSLVEMLSSSSPAYKSACLQAIKKLVAHSAIAKQLLADPMTIPLLLGLISYVMSDPYLKEEAVEVLALLVGATEACDFHIFQGLKELQSEHSISLFLHLISTSETQARIKFLQLLVELSHKSEQARELIRLDDDAIAHLYSCLENGQPAVRRWTMELVYSISNGHLGGVPLPPTPRKEAVIHKIASTLTHSPDPEERSVAAGIIGQLPKDDTTIDDLLLKSDVLKAIHEIICGVDMESNQARTVPNSGELLLENALAALLHYTEPSKIDLQKQVGKLELHPSLIRVLSSRSSLAKQRAAIALAHLSQSTSLSFSRATVIPTADRKAAPLGQLLNLFPNFSWCCSTSSEIGSMCSVHGTACSSKDTFCLVKTDAMMPLMKSLKGTDSGVQEAALMALETLLTDDRTLSQATATIVDYQGIDAILHVLEKGSHSAKPKALDLFEKILSHTNLTNPLDPSFRRVEGVLIQLLHEDGHKKKAALVLKQMKVIPEQSSYF
ncbi:U-box domain-containing protein 44-like isoform X2 [Syzygium oleosum]|uniref:U-box domain-containing protein 44-like isoform X2 n=1 Tax=Syzygium oleosum TaxID=219896 RepID=UPI0011D26419|nr:U-box domain-containing protein 44-like isoform X2 [Syzygium oleosum]